MIATSAANAANVASVASAENVVLAAKTVSMDPPGPQVQRVVAEAARDQRAQTVLPAAQV